MAAALDKDIMRVPLGPMDHIAPGNIPRSMIYLSLKPDVSSHEAFGRLRTGLRRAALQVPWLTGRVYWQPRETADWRPGQLEIRYEPQKDPSALLRMRELDASVSFAKLRDAGFPLDIINEEVLLWGSPFEADFTSGIDVFSAQATFITGGCLLALSIVPAASDGTAMLTVTKLWADHCANALDGRTDSAVFRMPYTFDRSVLDIIWKETTNPLSPNNDQHAPIHHLVGLQSLDAVGTDHRGHGDISVMRPSIFYMPHAAYTNLRKECVADAGQVDVSGTDLICALIWRSVVRAWVNMTNEQTPKHLLPKLATLAVPFDARPKLTQSLKASFLGNLNFENKLTLPLETLIDGSTTIPWIARKISDDAAGHGHKAALNNAYRVLQDVPEYGVESAQLRASRMSATSASVGILSPVVLPFNDTCFGEDVFGNQGKPEAFRPLMGACNRGYRTCFVIPRKYHGGIEFVMTLFEHEMEFLRHDGEFGRYAFPI